MTLQPSSASRRFPHISWAWPNGSRHKLITAAIHRNDETAFAAIKDWLRETDLDDATFAEHRLLSAITTRFAHDLAQMPEYARLCGLQRLNWTRSRMAIAISRPALEEMVNAGLRIILLKGACRVALDMDEQKSRTSYDLDLLFHPDDFEKAFEILAAGGWHSTRGESVLGLRARLSSIRARNFKKGRFGDIDLHRSAYHLASSSEACDQALLNDTQPVSYYDLPMYIPSVEERLTMAIGHGGWDGHSHSDWLVDAARILDRESVDWEKFANIIRARRLLGPAAIALSYLDQEMGLQLPDRIRDNIYRQRRFSKASQISAMLLAKDTDALNRGQKIARGIVQGVERIRFSGRDKSHDTPVFRALTRKALVSPDATPALEQQVALPTQLQPGIWAFDLTLEMPSPRKPRRIELELNGQDRNLCHLQALHVRSTAAHIVVRFRGQVDINANDPPITVSALPGKLMEEGLGAEDHDKYAAIPFFIRSADFQRRR
ncbi:hypothetical protein AN191_00370 [Loktanella sp. 5RATIMAR09]|uniref:nucleotidyltransferase family protein n=1 Tax=Loktanella sp. 5RATIMAR09 TaxID=1225655 RepID=UPI0006EBCF94|nr:nucleotidyltransferase family protein [Loktanella sp. 5RATIMAR09]KQI73397.1 hypothetical protein AN191_00370 [Loktanella sp. 5RATIMAR09]